MHKRNRKEWKNRILSALLSVAMVLSSLPPMTMPTRAAGDTFIFSSGAVLLDESFSGDNVVIQNGVFSVAVKGAQNVNIMFEGVTIDRRYITDSQDSTFQTQPVEMSNPPAGYTLTDLREVSDALYGNGNGVAPTCPFLITGNSTVTAVFNGKCTFYAGTNDCEVDADGYYTPAQGGAGFAGIQVDSGSTLTIRDAADLTVYGAHQLGSAGEIVGPNGKADYSDVLRANADIRITDSNGQEDVVYDDPWNSTGKVPTGASADSASGGAGIGGGAAYNTGNGGTGSNNSAYTAGTPGTIIIEGGKIEAFGGHQAAGIGGGTNSAATSDRIVINGGTVTAHGGRWAAGIGDGDSYHAGASNTFGNNGDIEINGGTVTAYGGVASPGIGSTDEKENNTLEIAINGGTVHAFSGFPSGFSGTYKSEAPAAIGAGSKSTMADNSIFISSNADLSCAGFGNYSLTEDGKTATTIPTINIDPEGYLLLLRTENYYSTEERVLKLYEPQTRTNPNNETECLVYVDQGSGTNDPDFGKKYYVDPKTQNVYDENWQALDTEDVPENLSLYVDKDSVLIQSIQLAYYFRSIALTLPDPGQYKYNLYALAVPVNGVTSNVNKPGDGSDIVLTVEAHTQGTQSGAISYPSQHNMGMDATSKPLTDLDIDGTATTDGLIGDGFAPAVYAYTVYVDAHATSAKLYAAFEGLATGPAAELWLNDNPITSQQVGSSTTWVVNETIDMTDGDEKIVRLKKKDSDVGAGGTISYKITLIKKGDYQLELTDPSKVYDGQPAATSATMAYEGAPYDVTIINSQSEMTVSGVSPGTTVTLAEGVRYQYSSYMSTRWIDYTMTVESVPVQSTPNARLYVVHFKVTNTSSGSSTGGNYPITVAGGHCAGWLVTYPEDGGTPTIKRQTSKPSYYTMPSGAAWVTATQTQVSRLGSSSRLMNLSASDTGIGIQYQSNTPTNLFSFGNATLTPGDQNSGGQALAYEQAELAGKLGIDGAKFPYEGSGTYQWDHTVNLRNNATKTFTWSYTADASGHYEVDVVPGSQGATVDLSEADLQDAVLTYYTVSTSNDGSTILVELPGPPTNVGNYRVKAEIKAQSYTAMGSRAFTITPRPITVLQIENWLTYMTSDEVKELQNKNAAELVISIPGAFLLDDVIPGDDVTASAGTVFYNKLDEIIVSYGQEKITLQDVALSGADAGNYTTASVQYVFGQIAYNMKGAIFRKTENGDWRKYYPVESDDPVNEGTADYHSPVSTVTKDGVEKELYVTHAEYVKARTVQDGEKTARYAVDIEYGLMQFMFYRSRWDVNDLEYKATSQSEWVGMDGVNNQLVLYNYSNRPVWYRMVTDIDFFYEEIIPDSGQGISAWIAEKKDGTNRMPETRWDMIPAATPGDSTGNGVEERAYRYLHLSGVPRQDVVPYMSVGSVIIYVSPTDLNSP